MYFQFKNMGIKPWEIKGRVLVEDLRVLAMMEILMSDRAKYAKKKSENDAEMKRTQDKLNAESKAKGKSGYHRRSK